MALMKPRRALMCLLLLSGAHAKKKPPTALEAGFKRRITAKLNSSVEAAAQHLVSRLGMTGSVFGGYELDLPNDEDSTATPSWRHSCLEVNERRDSIEHCGIIKLQALTTLCDAGHGPAAQQVIKRHLQALKKDSVDSLGIKRMNFKGAVVWVLQKSSTSNEQDASPAFQAGALMGVVRCADAIGDKSYFQEAESWFQGLKMVFNSGNWKDSNIPFHKAGIIWESLSVVVAHLPRASTFVEDVLDYVSDLEIFLRQQWEDNHELWSFATARALVVRRNMLPVKSKKSRQLNMKWAQEHVERFMGTSRTGKFDLEDVDVSQGILSKIGAGAYTCGPLQGLTSLAAIIDNAKLIQVVLQLLEKDIDKYQISADNQGPAGLTGDGGLQRVEGAFFRDEAQLKMERRRSLRLDDVAQCVISLVQALKTLNGIIGVELEQADGEDAAEPGHEGSEDAAATGSSAARAGEL